MERDPVRQKIKDMLWLRGMNMRQASAAIGRGPSYMQQFLERGVPAVLSYSDSEKLAAVIGCDANELRHAEAPKRKPRKRRRRTVPTPVPGAPLAAVPEMAVEASAGPGMLNEEFTAETARWYLPEGMIRHEGHASPDNMRILLVRGNSMEPEMREGDRVMVDTARRMPATGEMFVLWDGTGLVVKRIEAGRDADPPTLRLISANRDYPPYTCLAENAHIVGKVLWTLRRV